MLCDVILPLFWVTFCQADETIAGYVQSGTSYQLVEYSGLVTDESAEFSVVGRRQVELKTPCATYIGRVDVPLPWFNVILEQHERVDCNAQAFDSDVFKLINAATLAEVSGDIIILSNDAGEELVFVAQP